jgi:hypothetical protein
MNEGILRPVSANAPNVHAMTFLVLNHKTECPLAKYQSVGVCAYKKKKQNCRQIQ